MRHPEPRARISAGTARRLVAPLLAAGLLALGGCSQTEPGGGTENAGGIRLTGRVIGTNNTPVAGVVVSLVRTGMTDTTDALGRYVLTRKEGGEGGEDVVLDTLRFSRGGQPLGRVSVLDWVEDVPDVQVIQRDISGLVDMEGLEATRIEAVLKGDGIDTAAPVIADFYYNALSGNYSGFLYFPQTSTVSNYTVQINIYGTGNALLGQSVVVPFNSFAGNITVPPFSAGNSVPVAHAGFDTAVTLGGTILLKGSATDAFGGTITKWEWSIGGSPFAQTTTGDTAFSRSSPGTYACILRVTDNDGNTATDTMVAMVVAQGQGTLWTERPSGTTTALSKVVWTGTQFVAIGRNNTVLTSPDGIAWTPRTIDPQQSNLLLQDLAWNGRALIITLASGSPIGHAYYRSTDGITWSGSTLPYLGMSTRMLVSAADTTFFVAPQANTNRLFARSEDDGVSWFVDTLPPEQSGHLSSVWRFTRHAGRFLGVGGNAATASSISGGDWTRHTTTLTFADPPPPGGVYSLTMMAVVSTGTHAVAVGYGGHVMRSVDGVSWARPRQAFPLAPDPDSNTGGDLHDVAWTGTTLVAVGNGITILSADRGENWTQVQAGDNNLSSVAWNGTRLVAVGPSGKILTSE